MAKERKPRAPKNIKSVNVEADEDEINKEQNSSKELKDLLFNSRSKWGTNDYAEFKKNVDLMNDSELKKLCQKHAIVPAWHPQEIRAQLLRSFKSDPTNIKSMPDIKPITFEHIDRNDPEMRKLFNF